MPSIGQLGAWLLSQPSPAPPPPLNAPAPPSNAPPPSKSTRAPRRGGEWGVSTTRAARHKTLTDTDNILSFLRTPCHQCSDSGKCPFNRQCTVQLRAKLHNPVEKIKELRDHCLSGSQSSAKHSLHEYLYQNMTTDGKFTYAVAGVQTCGATHESAHGISHIMGNRTRAEIRKFKRRVPFKKVLYRRKPVANLIRASVLDNAEVIGSKQPNAVQTLMRPVDQAKERLRLQVHCSQSYYNAVVVHQHNTPTPTSIPTACTSTPFIYFFFFSAKESIQR